MWTVGSGLISLFTEQIEHFLVIMLRLSPSNMRAFKGCDMIKLIIFNLSSRALAPCPTFAAQLNVGPWLFLCRAFASHLTGSGTALTEGCMVDAAVSKWRPQIIFFFRLWDPVEGVERHFSKCFS